MANTSAAFASLIVPQLLERGNYYSWNVFMVDYLISQELWNGIIVPFAFSADHPLLSYLEWEKRNAAALHAIKISCGPESFILIKRSISANQAFEMLFEMHKSVPETDEIIPEMNVAMATTIVPVPELLASDNYKKWSICMKSHLVSQDLWDAVLYDWVPAGVDTKEWIKKDAAALHVIQISCRPKKFDEIKEITSAKIAWNTLEQKHTEKHPEDGPPSDILDYWEQQGVQIMERIQSLIVQNVIDKGDVDEVRDFIKRNPENKTLGHWTGFAALQYATMVGKLNIVQALVEDMPTEEERRQKDQFIGTALNYAAGFGYKEIAEYLVRKDSALLYMEDMVQEIPVVAACRLGYKELTYFLYSKTQFEILLLENGKQGSKLLLECFHAKRFDIMSDVLHRDSSHSLIDEHWKDLLDGFAETPAAFIIGSELTFWQWWIYDCLKVQIHSDFWAVNIDKQEKRFEEIPLPGQLWKLASILLPFLGIKQIHALKLRRVFARESLRLICQRLSELQMRKVEDLKAIRKALTKAIENGIYDFLIEMTNTNADFLIVTMFTTGKPFLMDAIAFRQEKISRFIVRLPLSRLFFLSLDPQSNNVLHIAGQLASNCQLSRISGAALQMQREIQWFKEVESLVSQYEKDHKNENGETPYQVLDREHKHLLKEVEDWMKGLASSYIIVGTLIITIMFAATFTLPGGNNQIEGFPIFKSKAAFMVYIISDAISLFAAATSLIIFLGFLTSRYNMEDFHKSIPKKLMTGLSALFISLVAMMITFCSAIFLMLENRWWIIIPSMVFASIPVSLFVRLQFPLLLEIYVLTYRSPIFSEESSLTSKIKAFFFQKKKIE